jgi:predicted heme/steroid binding protein
MLIKLDRFFAWVLFATMLLYFISGYGMTKGLIDATLATKLHLSSLTYIILIAFTFHTSYAIHMAFKRWQIWNAPAKILLFLFFATFFGSFIYIDRYYQTKPVRSSQSSQISSSDDESDGIVSINQNSNITNSNSSTNQKTFTISELAKYNGQNGNPAYLAVDGTVYDLSAIFVNGRHYFHSAGQELTNAFYTRHVKSALAKYPIVGILVK